jgi:hypothetical protein
MLEKLAFRSRKDFMRRCRYRPCFALILLLGVVYLESLGAFLVCFSARKVFIPAPSLRLRTNGWLLLYLEFGS